jgi:pimeloyl-ACP methyl ester carboxylesterase
MATQESYPNLEELDRYLAEGDIPALRETLFKLTEKEQELLKEEMGEYNFDRLYAAARRVIRGEKKGRVILLHGIMGSTLDVVKRRDADRVWINYWRLFNGRIADLKLTLEGGPVQGGIKVRVAGQNRKAYLPMLMELNEKWHIKPFSYDWRQDINKSAEHLADLVTTFGGGKPVHLVAHSMGGLVSRCFIQSYPQLWQSMCDEQ